MTRTFALHSPHLRAVSVFVDTTQLKLLVLVEKQGSVVIIYSWYSKGSISEIEMVY